MVSSMKQTPPKHLRLIPLGEVMQRTALSRSAIYREISESRFPKSVPLTPKRVAWLESEIEDWIEAKLAKAGH